MGKTMVCAGAIAALLLADAALAQSGEDYAPTGSRITPSNKPRASKPLERGDIDKAVEKMFRTADTDRDGLLALAEFNAVISARKDKVIAERFAQVDTDRNQSISTAEFAQWQRALGAVVLSDRQGLEQDDPLVAEDLPLEFSRNDDVALLTRLIEPLNATMLVAANTDYDAGASLAEILAYEHQRFDAADTNKDGWLTWDEAEALMPKEVPGG